MIAYLRGTVEERSDGSVVLDVYGVGYRVFVSARTLAELPPPPEPVQLFTYELLREEGHVLYGFRAREERDVFALVLSVNGVGPRTALNILSAMNAEEILGAIRGGNVEAFARVSGVGKKIAQRILLELQGKVGAVERFVLSSAASGPVAEAIQALVALGASEEQAGRAVAESQRVFGKDASVEDLVRAALRRIHA